MNSSSVCRPSGVSSRSSLACSRSGDRASNERLLEQHELRRAAAARERVRVTAEIDEQRARVGHHVAVERHDRALAGDDRAPGPIVRAGLRASGASTAKVTPPMRLTPIAVESGLKASVTSNSGRISPSASA